MSSGRSYKPFQVPADYRQRLPTEYPFAVALGLYFDRVLIVGAVALIAVAASLIVFLAVLAFQVGYGIVVVIVVVVILFNLGRSGGSGGSGSSGSGPKPPGSNSNIDKRRAATPQPAPAEPEKVLIPAGRTREKVY